VNPRLSYLWHCGGSPRCIPECPQKSTPRKRARRAKEPRRARGARRAREHARKGSVHVVLQGSSGGAWGQRRSPSSSLKWALGPWGRAWGAHGPRPKGPIMLQNIRNICEKAPRSIASHLLFSSFLREYLWIEAERSIVYNSRKRMPLFGAPRRQCCRTGGILREL